MAEEKATDVYTAQDLEEANSVRKRLLLNSRRLWLFVSKNREGGYVISASNEWGGKITDSLASYLKEECQLIATENQAIDIDESDFKTPVEST